MQYPSRRAMGILREMFPGHLISLRGDIGWPARSPDLNPCDFFLWGYLKSKVYSNRLQSVEQLKNAIRQEITAIPHEMTSRVIDNFRERLRQCVDNNGSHLTDLIFKTQWNRMALYVLFENKNTFLFLYFICLLLKRDQIILPDPVPFIYIHRTSSFAQLPFNHRLNGVTSVISIFKSSTHSLVIWLPVLVAVLQRLFNNFSNEKFVSRYQYYKLQHS